MANKFGRKFSLAIQTNDTLVESEMEFIEIADPFTIQFNINRDIMSSLNTMQMNVFNLSEKTRTQLFKDRFSSKYRRIIFRAGYNRLSICFQGNVFSCFSERKGSDIVTVIDARDGGHSNRIDQVSKTYNKGTSKKELLNDLVDSMKTLSKGTISVDDVTKQRATIADGGSLQLIKKEVDGVFIDLERVNVLKDNEVIKGFVPLLTSETGLLGTPKRQDSYLTIDSLFEPQINIGQAIEIESTVQKEFNGQYKVIGVKHSGTISESISGSVKTTFSLLMPDQITGGFVQV